MKLLGFEIKRTTKAAPPVPVDQNRGGWYRILESFTGAWQQNVTVDFNSVLSNPTVFACMTLIASDIAKLAIRLVEMDGNGIWSPVESPAFSPVLRKPNRFQNHVQFYENWALSKLMRGNAYVLLQRDNRRVVTAQYLLAPDRVTPLVSDDGSVFYQLKADNVVGLREDVMVPASEIMHDRFNCLFHPLVGLSPIFANGVLATQGLAIQGNSASFFANKSRPGGILTAPGQISDENAARLKAYWDSNFTGENAGKVAVVGDGLSYQQMSISAADSQLVEQAGWTDERICSTFHVPPYKVGIGEIPKYNTIQALNVEYYSHCLQVLIEAIEACQDEALGIGIGNKVEGKTYGTEFDIENLLRMDSVTQAEVLDKLKNIMEPNEQRAKLSLGPTEGGNVVLRQQQEFSLAALAKRDAQEDPFATGKTESAAPAPEPPANDNDEVQAAAALVAILKGLR